ncbi:NUDIX domain-containing protein [Reinekea forsetii]|nr:NUDIX domain-containing protein [Reinekea forsetii]
MQRDTDQFKYKIKARKSLHQGFYTMDSLTVSHQRFDGTEQEIKRELLVRPDAVCALLVDFNADKFVFVEQFRVGAMQGDNPWLIELVAGLIDKDESPEEVGRREAQEEAGVELGRMELITQYYPSPGGTNERIHLYVAEVDSRDADGIHGLDEESEDIRVVTPSIDEGLAWLANGTINNAASIIACQWFMLNKERLKQQWL